MSSSLVWAGWTTEVTGWACGLSPRHGGAPAWAVQAFDRLRTVNGETLGGFFDVFAWGNQPDQRPAGGVGAIRRRSAAGLHPGNSQRVDVGPFRRSPARAAGVAPLLAPYLEMLLAVVAGFGHMALRPTTGRRNGRI